MRNGNSGNEARERPAERARGVTLHHQQVRSRPKLREKRRCNAAHMSVRVLLAWAMEVHGGVPAKPKLVRPQLWVLAGEDERRRQAAGGQRVGNGSHLDRFGPGADHQPDIGRTQPSP
jgi:hypothetical protein